MSKHSRWYIVLAAVLVLSFALSGCAPQAAAPAPAPTQAPAAEPDQRPRLWSPLRRQSPKQPSRLP